MFKTIISIQTANYHPDTSSATDKSTLYSIDINSNNYASWKQESIWFHSVDKSIGMYVTYLSSLEFKFDDARLSS